MTKLRDFIIIGAQRCGTTSLYNALVQHPSILPASQKEVHYFDLNFSKGMSWYQSQFPDKAGKITGEASPYYIFHPLVPRRVYEHIPDVKIIILVRDPIKRAISHFFHEKLVLQTEPLSFAEAIRSEASRLQGEEERIIREKNYYSFAHQHYSYMARGSYSDQIDRWLKFFDRKQIAIVKSEELFTHPQASIKSILSFIGISDSSSVALELPRLNRLSLEDTVIDAETTLMLKNHFREPNERLKGNYGICFP